MDDYISREAVIRHLKGCSEKELNKNSPFGMITSSVLNKMERAFSEMPAADVQPVKHGQWIPHGCNSYECSNCHKMIYNAKDMREHAFCGTCGSNNER